MKNSKTITILAFCIIAAAGIFPAVVIIPVTGIITITCAVLMLREAGK